MWLIHFSEIEDREDEEKKNYQRHDEILLEFKTLSPQFLVSLLAALGEHHNQQSSTLSFPSGLFPALVTSRRNWKLAPPRSGAPSIPCQHPCGGHLPPLLGVLSQLHRNYL